jgi:hypothetical protein
MTGDKPDLSNLHPWGCRVHVHDTSGSKLDGRSKIGRWVGFDEESKTHRVYWEGKRSITVERSVKFNFEEELTEGVPLEGEWDVAEEDDEQSSSRSYPKATVEEIPDDDAPIPHDHLGNDVDIPEIVAEPEGQMRHVRVPSSYIQRLQDGEGVTSARPSDPLLSRGMQDTADVADEWEMVSVEDFAMASVTEASQGIMPSFEEAKKRPDWPKWQEAITAELANLEANGTWELIERPSGVNVVDCEWVLRIKKNAAGEIKKYKACLVARGFTQVYGVDFYETYAPVANSALRSGPVQSFRLFWVNR